jgi:hypothetical protein
LRESESKTFWTLVRLDANFCKGETALQIGWTPEMMRRKPVELLSFAFFVFPLMFLSYSYPLSYPCPVLLLLSLLLFCSHSVFCLFILFFSAFSTSIFSIYSPILQTTFLDAPSETFSSSIFHLSPGVSLFDLKQDVPDRKYVASMRLFLAPSMG